MELDKKTLEKNEQESLIQLETEKLIAKLDKKIKICNIISSIFSIVGFYFLFKIYKYGIDILSLAYCVSCYILALGFFMDSNRFSNYTIELYDRLIEE